MQSSDSKLTLVASPSSSSSTSAEVVARAAARWGIAVDGCKLLGWMFAGGTVGEIALLVLQALGVFP